MTVWAAGALPSGGGEKTHDTRRARVVAVGGLLSRAIPMKCTRPSGNKVAWIGEAYHPSAVRKVPTELQASTAVGVVAGTAPRGADDAATIAEWGVGEAAPSAGLVTDWLPPVPRAAGRLPVGGGLGTVPRAPARRSDTVASWTAVTTCWP